MTDHKMNEAFQKGKDANRSGVPRECNPFPEASDEWLEWSEGWDDAKHDDIDEKAKSDA